MSKFDDFKGAVLDGAEDLARQLFQDSVVAARDDVSDFLAAAQDDLVRWTKQLREGKLTRKQFGSLVRGQKDLATLAALTQAGRAAASLQRFRDGLIDLVVNKAFSTFL
jgi:hypothetical protein